MTIKNINCPMKLLLSVALALTSMAAFSVQDVYEYQNKEGVTEFTDQPKADTAPEKHIQIEKRTPEQEAQSKEKLNEIMDKDKELDKKLARDRQLENERLRRETKARQDNSQQQPDETDSSSRRYRRGALYPPKPVHPIAPKKSGVKPKPGVRR